MIRKVSLAKGMFSTKISLAKGIRSKTGAAHPRQKFLEYPQGFRYKGATLWISLTSHIKDVSDVDHFKCLYKK